MIYGIAVFGFRWEIIVGSVLPDILYVLAIMRAHLDIRRAKNSGLYVLGERMHSFLILPPIFTIIYLLVRVQGFMLLAESVLLHLVLDVITHRDHGPRFLWPLTDRYYPRGLGQWSDKRIMLLTYICGVMLLLASRNLPVAYWDLRFEHV